MQIGLLHVGANAYDKASRDLYLDLMTLELL
jgi:hypothetical protein